MINRKGQYISLLVEDFATLLISRSAPRLWSEDLKCLAVR